MGNREAEGDLRVQPVDALLLAQDVEREVIQKPGRTGCIHIEDDDTDTSVRAVVEIMQEVNQR